MKYLSRQGFVIDSIDRSFWILFTFKGRIESLFTIGDSLWMGPTSVAG